MEQAILIEKEQIARTVEMLSTNARLLVVTDFDGTISQFTENHADAVLHPTARVALRKLSELPNTVVAVMSGRELADLASKFEHIEKVRLVGSHGHEFDITTTCDLTNDQKKLLELAQSFMSSAVEDCAGTSLEIKPHGIVFHFRGAVSPPVVAIDALRRKLKSLNSGVVREGNLVLEYSVIHSNKGEALLHLQDQVAPTITLFIGDDVTDESAFRQLGTQGVSIKVGAGESSAQYRVDTVECAVKLLAQIAERRSAWIDSQPCSQIDQHIFLSDLRTTALVDKTGTITWLCLPRIDGEPLFGSIVSGAVGGHFSVNSGGSGSQSYLTNTLIGKTDFNGISVTDFFDCSGGRSFHRAGRSDLVRLIEGSGDVFVEFAPKFNFGRTPTRLSKIDNGLKIECGQQRLILLSPGWEWELTREGTHDSARSKKTLHQESLSLILLIGTSSPSPSTLSVAQMLQETRRFWELWATSLQLPKRHASLVSRSAIVLRGLSYGPTGAIAAAATTSLPETIGGIRNWDYRYCWPRDACLSASALLRLNASGPAIRLLDWLIHIVLDADTVQFLSPLYTVTGRTVPSEAEVTEAFGYRGSRPVRIGNLAAVQLQLDTLAPIAELMWKLAQRGVSLTTEHLDLAERLVGLINSRWKDADSGIWEVRGVQRHYVHSKLMCWYAVTCCANVSNYLGIERKDWIRLADEIRQEIETKGYNYEMQSYVAAYDLQEADSGLLWIILSGFHEPNHPRCQGTLRFILDRLVHNNSVHRYHFDDALHGAEGEFIICRCWLIEALALMDRNQEAQELLDVMIARIEGLGLLAEEWNNKYKCALGNYPQAYSHLGLINAVCALEREFV